MPGKRSVDRGRHGLEGSHVQSVGGPDYQPPANEHGPASLQLWAAVLVFVLGSSVYLFDRSAADIYFIPSWWTLADGTPGLFGSLGGSLPSFVHPFCFALWTSVLLMPWRVSPLLICLGWFGLEAALEIAQAQSLANRIIDWLPGWFADWPILANVPHFFSRGLFDPGDLLAIALGSVAAYLIILFSCCSNGERQCQTRDTKND
jgi:hypothetical protein